MYKLSTLGIIPVRYDSKRFPGRPLYQANYKPLIQHIYDQLIDMNQFDDLIVAADDPRILEVLDSLCINHMKTSKDCNNGTERCAEVLKNINKDYDVVINIQGDQIGVKSKDIEKLLFYFKIGMEDVKISSLFTRIQSNDELFSSNTVKVVINQYMQAMYFSRSPIPYARDYSDNDWLNSVHEYYKHIGIYAYRPETLLELANSSFCSAEMNEKLEQIRWLYRGHKIYMNKIKSQIYSFDTKEDADYYFKNK